MCCWPKQVKACGKSPFLILGWSSNCDSLCQTRVIRLVPWCWCWKLVIKNVIKQTFWLQFVTLKTRCGFLLRQNTGKNNFFLLHVSISCSPNQHLSFTLCTTSLFFLSLKFPVVTLKESKQGGFKIWRFSVLLVVFPHASSRLYLKNLFFLSWCDWWLSQSHQ